MDIVAVWQTQKGGPGYYPYTEDYVRSLRGQLWRVGHELTLLSDEDAGDLPLANNWTGWWSKAQIFAPAYKHLRPFLALDLDNFIMDDLKPILRLDGERMWMIRQFLSRTDLAEMGLIIVPRSELSDVIWEDLKVASHAQTPAEVIRRRAHRFIPDVVGGIYSYKGHQLQDGPPADARVICFHGKPRPHEASAWAKDFFHVHI